MQRRKRTIKTITLTQEDCLNSVGRYTTTIWWKKLKPLHYEAAHMNPSWYEACVKQINRNLNEWKNNQSFSSESKQKLLRLSA